MMNVDKAAEEGSFFKVPWSLNEFSEGYLYLDVSDINNNNVTIILIFTIIRGHRCYQLRVSIL